MQTYLPKRTYDISSPRTRRPRDRAISILAPLNASAYASRRIESISWGPL